MRDNVQSIPFIAYLSGEISLNIRSNRFDMCIDCTIACI